MNSLDQLYTDVDQVIETIKTTKKCNKCLEMKPSDQYYKSARVNSLSYVCKPCHRQAIKQNKRTPGTYAFFYKKFEQVRRHARKRGILFELTTEDYRDMKEQAECYYCHGITNVITIDRKDNDLGYTKENTVGCCHFCNKLKYNNFNEKEMLIIGRAVKMYHDRINKTYVEADHIRKPKEDDQQKTATI